MKPALDLLRAIQLLQPDSPSDEGGSTAFTASATEMLKIPDVPIGAVLIRSAAFGPVWLALDPATADEIRAEEQQRDEPCPVLAPEDVAHMESMSERAIRGALAIIKIFPAARIK